MSSQCDDKGIEFCFPHRCEEFCRTCFRCGKTTKHRKKGGHIFPQGKWSRLL